jgi:hypothetical protein
MAPPILKGGTPGGHTPLTGRPISTSPIAAAAPKPTVRIVLPLPARTVPSSPPRIGAERFAAQVQQYIDGGMPRSLAQQNAQRDMLVEQARITGGDAALAAVGQIAFVTAGAAAAHEQPTRAIGPINVSILEEPAGPVFVIALPTDIPPQSIEALAITLFRYLDYFLTGPLTLRTLTEGIDGAPQLIQISNASRLSLQQLLEQLREHLGGDHSLADLVHSHLEPAFAAWGRADALLDAHTSADLVPGLRADAELFNHLAEGLFEVIALGDLTLADIHNETNDFLDIAEALIQTFQAQTADGDPARFRRDPIREYIPRAAAIHAHLAGQERAEKQAAQHRGLVIANLTAAIRLAAAQDAQRKLKAELAEQSATPAPTIDLDAMRGKLESALPSLAKLEELEAAGMIPPALAETLRPLIAATHSAATALGMHSGEATAAPVPIETEINPAVQGRPTVTEEEPEPEELEAATVLQMEVTDTPAATADQGDGQQHTPQEEEVEPAAEPTVTEEAPAQAAVEPVHIEPVAAPVEPKATTTEPRQPPQDHEEAIGRLLELFGSLLSIERRPERIMIDDLIEGIDLATQFLAIEVALERLVGVTLAVGGSTSGASRLLREHVPTLPARKRQWRTNPEKVVHKVIHKILTDLTDDLLAKHSISDPSHEICHAVLKKVEPRAAADVQRIEGLIRRIANYWHGTESFSAFEVLNFLTKEALSATLSEFPELASEAKRAALESAFVKVRAGVLRPSQVPEHVAGQLRPIVPADAEVTKTGRATGAEVAANAAKALPPAAAPLAPAMLTGTGTTPTLTPEATAKPESYRDFSALAAQLQKVSKEAAPETDRLAPLLVQLESYQTVGSASARSFYFNTATAAVLESMQHETVRKVEEIIEFLQHFPQSGADVAPRIASLEGDVASIADLLHEEQFEKDKAHFELFFDTLESLPGSLGDFFILDDPPSRAEYQDFVARFFPTDPAQRGHVTNRHLKTAAMEMFFGSAVYEALVEEVGGQDQAYKAVQIMNRFLAEIEQVEDTAVVRERVVTGTKTEWKSVTKTLPYTNVLTLIGTTSFLPEDVATRLFAAWRRERTIRELTDDAPSRTTAPTTDPARTAGAMQATHPRVNFDHIRLGAVADLPGHVQEEVRTLLQAAYTHHQPGNIPAKAEWMRFNQVENLGRNYVATFYSIKGIGQNDVRVVYWVAPDGTIVVYCMATNHGLYDHMLNKRNMERWAERIKDLFTETENPPNAQGPLRQNFV